MRLQDIPKIKHTHSNNFFLLAGPCAIESEEMAFQIAEKIVSISNKLEIPFIFKGSFKKANRSRIDNHRSDLHGPPQFDIHNRHA